MAANLPGVLDVRKGLDVSLGCARVSDMADEDEEKLHWIVVFNKGGKIYPYMYRTVEYMAAIVKDHHIRHNKYPYRMWVIVDDEVQRVEITD